MTNMPQWTTLLYNEPLAITPLRNEALCQAAQNRFDRVLPSKIDASVLDLKPRAFAHEASNYLDGDFKPFPMKDGIAVVRTIGTLVKRGGWMEAESGMMGYDRIVSQMREAHRDPDVEGIFWVIDSPGGHTSRMIQAAKEIGLMSQSAGGKPIYAYVDEMAASAGYVLASAADVILAPEAALGGCLGVILNLIDTSGLHDKMGLKAHVVRSGWSDRKALGQDGEVIDAETIAGYQKIVDDAGESLVEFVSAMRDLSPKAVKATRGETLGAVDMRAAGLLDEICSESEAWSLLKDEIRSR